MLAKTLSAFILIFAPVVVGAAVVVLSPAPGCRTLALQRSNLGTALKISGDPTRSPAVPMSQSDYTVEVLDTMDKVHAVYRDIFRQRAMSESEISSELEKIRWDDNYQLISGLENTVYFVFKHRNETRAVIRAVAVRAGETRQLPLEAYIRVPQGNRVELGRALNLAGSYSAIIADEMAIAVATYFHQYFGDEDYDIFALTDAARARNYRSRYGFTSAEQPQLDALHRFLVQQTGSDFYFRYVGHIQKAYKIAFSGQLRVAEALDFLRKEQAKPGLSDFIPNIVAQATILAADSQFAEAVKLSDYLENLGRAEINRDYNLLWRARIVYDPITQVGDTEQAQKMLDDYLKENKLILSTFNHRAYLFITFYLKILMGAEKFEQAGRIITAYKNILTAGIKEKESYIKLIKSQYLYASAKLNAWSPDYSYRMLLQAVQRNWDISTSRDPFSSLALYYESYLWASELAKATGQLELAQHYERVANWLKEQRLTPEYW